MIVLLWDPYGPVRMRQNVYTGPSRMRRNVYTLFVLYCTFCTLFCYPVQGKSEAMRLKVEQIDRKDWTSDDIEGFTEVPNKDSKEYKRHEHSVLVDDLEDIDHHNDYDDNFLMYDELTQTQSLAAVGDSFNVLAEDLGAVVSEYLGSGDHQHDLDLLNDHQGHLSHPGGHVSGLEANFDPPRGHAKVSNRNANKQRSHTDRSKQNSVPKLSATGHLPDTLDHHHTDETTKTGHMHSHDPDSGYVDTNDHDSGHVDIEEEDVHSEMDLDSGMRKQYFGWLKNKKQIKEEFGFVHEEISDADHEHDLEHHEHDHDHHEHDHEHHEHNHELYEHDHEHYEHDHDHKHGHEHEYKEQDYDEHFEHYDDLDENDHSEHSEHRHEHSSHGHGHKGHSHGGNGRKLSELSASVWIVATASIFVISLIGVASVLLLPLLSNERGDAILQGFICIAVGTLVGDSFIHLAPHALMNGHSAESTWKGFLASMVVMAFISLDKILRYIGVNHGHSHAMTTFQPILKNEQDKISEDSFSQASTMMVEECGSYSDASILQEGSGKRSGPGQGRQSNTNLMVIIGDAVHNFADGIAIGAAFSIGYGPGLSTSIAVLCHELPHEIGDFAILIQNGMSTKTALMYNVLSSVTGFLGMCLGMVLGSSGQYSTWMIAGIMGVFLYVALVSMLPEISANSKTILFTNICGMVIGVVLLLVIGLYEDSIVDLLDV